jgi:spore photoproduct lyase
MAAFSHIYIERNAADYPLAKAVLEKLPHVIPVEIVHYKDVFNRPRQDFRAQKASPQLILAVKRAPFLYSLPPLCEAYGYERAFYTTPVLNCPYDCDFCFLQGVYPSAHIVVFVNDGDFFDAARKQTEPFFLSIAYENDLMALENLVSWTGRWLDFAGSLPHMEMEVRTRSANLDAIQGREAISNVVLAWSLSPPDIAARYEKRAPDPAERIEAARWAMDAGWRVRLCFEPIIRTGDWEKIYRDFIGSVFRVLPAGKVDSAVADVFRMGKDCFDTIFQKRDDTDIFAFRPVERDGGLTYPDHRDMGRSVRGMLSEYMSSGRVFGGEW